MTLNVDSFGDLADVLYAIGLAEPDGSLNGEWLSAPGDHLRTVLSNESQRAALLRLLEEKLEGDKETDSEGREWLVDSGNAVRSPSRDLDARTPVAVEFVANLSHTLTAPAIRDQVLLLAIVTSTTDPVNQPALTEPDLESLLRKSGHSAARRVHRRA